MEEAAAQNTGRRAAPINAAAAETQPAGRRTSAPVLPKYNVVVTQE